MGDALRKIGPTDLRYGVVRLREVCIEFGRPVPTFPGVCKMSQQRPTPCPTDRYRCRRGYGLGNSVGDQRESPLPSTNQIQTETTKQWSGVRAVTRFGA